jgi:hypothetical protein
MNIHDAKTGFVLTDQGIVAFQRFGNEWGKMFSSQRIPLRNQAKVSNSGFLNVKVVIWFLLSKYGSDPEKWGYPRIPPPPVQTQTLAEACGSDTESDTQSRKSDKDYAPKNQGRKVEAGYLCGIRHCSAEPTSNRAKMKV